MKVAVSIPDPIFAEVDALAKRLKLSRSKVYARALEDYVASHPPELTVEMINAAYEEIGDQSDPFVKEAARRIFERVEW
jgi:metal-responsive CopG/Arc/MetJ family transcriptional regulator